MGAEKPKQFLNLAGIPVIVRTLQALARTGCFDEIILVAPPHAVESCHDLVSQWKIERVHAIVAGGATRQQSVANGLAALSREIEIVAVHDGARPLVSPALVIRLMAEANSEGAAVPFLPLSDTVKRAAGKMIDGTVSREELRIVQTPQCFRRDWLEEALAAAESEEFTGTDVAALVERQGHRIRLVEGDPRNIKITNPDDMLVAEAFLGSKKGIISVGTGYDIHILQKDRRLILGGVTIPFPLGLAGHSDADVLSHALADALLGAASLGDIGEHFPDTDPAYKDVSSLVLLEKVAAFLRQEGWRILHLDATVIAEKPKLTSYKGSMRENIARSLGIETSAVSIKATTHEGLDSLGRSEAISCQAVATLDKAE